MDARYRPCRPAHYLYLLLTVPTKTRNVARPDPKNSPSQVESQRRGPESLPSFAPSVSVSALNRRRPHWIFHPSTCLLPSVLGFVFRISDQILSHHPPANHLTTTTTSSRSTPSHFHHPRHCLSTPSQPAAFVLFLACPLPETSSPPSLILAPWLTGSRYTRLHTLHYCLRNRSADRH